MDQGPYLVDTNVFVIDLRYPQDRNLGVNRRFLDAIKRNDQGSRPSSTCLSCAAFSRSTSIGAN